MLVLVTCHISRIFFFFIVFLNLVNLSFFKHHLITFSMFLKYVMFPFSLWIVVIYISNSLSPFLEGGSPSHQQFTNFIHLFKVPTFGFIGCLLYAQFCSYCNYILPSISFEFSLLFFFLLSKIEA